jgi:hypothetical protein
MTKRDLALDLFNAFKTGATRKPNKPAPTVRVGQPGDPELAAKAIVKAVESKNPPLRLLLGAAALKSGRIKLEQLKNDFDAWAETTIGADSPKN